MKKKIKTSWSELYLITALGCTLLFIEAFLPMTHHTRQIALIITLAAMFWLMSQWMRASRFKLIMSQNTTEPRNRLPVTRVQTHYVQPVQADNAVQSNI